MDITMKINLSEYAVVDGGTLDVEATLEKFQTDLVEYWETELKSLQEVSREMLGIFSENPQVHANVNYIVSETVRRCGGTPANWGALEERAKKFLKGAQESGLILVTKGPKGGVTIGEKHPAYVAPPAA